MKLYRLRSVIDRLIHTVSNLLHYENVEYAQNRRRLLKRVENMGISS